MDVTIVPVIDDEGCRVIGWMAVGDNGEQATGVHLDKQGAIDEALCSGYNPYMSDEELDAESEAITHGNW